MTFIVGNYKIFQSNSEVCKVNTWCRHDLQRPFANLTVYQKGIYCSGITLYNKLSIKVKSLSFNRRQFKLALKEFLL